MVLLDITMPDCCANCPMVFPVKDGMKTEYFCKLRWIHVPKENLFIRQGWCPMSPAEEVNNHEEDA